MNDLIFKMEKYSPAFTFVADRSHFHRNSIERIYVGMNKENNKVFTCVMCEMKNSRSCVIKSHTNKEILLSSEIDTSNPLRNEIAEALCKIYSIPDISYINEEVYGYSLLKLLGKELDTNFSKIIIAYDKGWF